MIRRDGATTAASAPRHTGSQQNTSAERCSFWKLGVKAGIVEKSGSWYSYDGTRIGQGREAAKNFLTQNVEISGKIEAQIRENAGVLSGALALGGDDSASAEED